MNLSTWAQYDTRSFEDTIELDIAVVPVEAGELILSEQEEAWLTVKIVKQHLPEPPKTEKT